MYICDHYKCGAIVPTVWGAYEFGKLQWFCSDHKKDNSIFIKNNESQLPKDLRLRNRTKLDLKKKRRLDIINDFLDEQMTLQEIADKYNIKVSSLREQLSRNIDKNLYKQVINRLSLRPEKLSTDNIDSNHT